MTEQVFVLGGAQTDFVVNWPRVSDEPLRDILAEAVTGASPTPRCPWPTSRRRRR